MVTGSKISLPRSETPQVSIIIASSVRTDLLHACLRSLGQFGPAGIAYETIVVLNEAGEMDEERLRTSFSGIRVTACSVNLGLAGAVNRARVFARGEYILLLHDDAEVLPAWMEALVLAAETHPEAGAIGSMVLSFDGLLQNAGNLLWRDATPTTRWWGALPAPSSFAEVRAVHYCGTSSLLVRASAWDAIGGMDEQFYPAYYVDTDLCMSLRQAGYAVLCQPASRIHHHRAASSSPHFHQFLLAQNRKRFLSKWATALEQHDPFESYSPEGVEQVLAREQAFAEQCRIKRRGFSPPVAPRAFDAQRQEREHADKARALHRAYIEYLEGRIGTETAG